jgi:hypothetical protein
MSSLLLSATAGSVSVTQTISYSGTISNSTLSPLSVEGKYIVDYNGNPVHLVGAYGVLKSKYYNDQIFHSETSLDAAKAMGMQVLRIGIDMASYVTTPYTYNDTFFSQPRGLDWVINWCNNNGIYVVLDPNFAISFGNYFSYNQGHGFPAYITPPQYYPNNQTGMYKAWQDFWLGNYPQEDSKNQLTDAILHVVSRYKNEPCIMAWEIPCNEPSIGNWMDPNVITPIYYDYVRGIIDDIRTIDPNRIVIVETFWYSPLNYLYADIGRNNTAYDIHPYGAGAYEYYDPSVAGIAQGAIWNKAGLEEWINQTIYEGFIQKFDRPVFIGEIDTTTENSSGNWYQWYSDIYNIFDEYGIWTSSGFRAGSGDIFGLWYSDGVTFKPQANVLLEESTVTESQLP